MLENQTWSTLVNIFRRRSFAEAFKKICRRLEPATSDEALRWILSNGTMTTETYCRNHSPSLWEETQSFGKVMEQKRESLVEVLPNEIGGAADYLLLYFVTRLARPEFSLETGVAAGWSSYAVLEALHRNRFGRLFSSDLPYFRINEAERYVGAVVPDSRRSRWSLALDGDDRAVPRFLSTIPQGALSLFHYDSDKSYASRAEVTRLIEPWLSPGATLIMDDIQDNTFFRDWVTEKGLEFTIIEFNQKYLGIIEAAGRQLSLTIR